MILSTTPGLGKTHVRGGRVMRVLHDHVVAADDESPVTARMGDLVIEVIDQRRDRVIAHSYLSGAAIRRLSYDMALHRYEPGRHARLPAVEVALRSSAVDALDSVQAAIEAVKYSGVDVATFSAVTPHYTAAAHAVVTLWQSYAPPGVEPSHCHLIGAIRRGARGVFRRKNPGVFIHLQPRSAASKLGVTAFQAALLFSVVDDDAATPERGQPAAPDTLPMGDE